jgi:hypothetical protein
MTILTDTIESHLRNLQDELVEIDAAAVKVKEKIERAMRLHNALDNPELQELLLDSFKLGTTIRYFSEESPIKN